MASRVRVEVDRSVCRGTGMCAGIAPEYFELDEERRSRPRAEVVDAAPVLSDAADCCPTEAISVRPVDGADRR